MVCPVKPNTIKSLLLDGQEILSGASISSAGIESRIVLGFVTGHSLEHLLSHGFDDVSSKNSKKFFSLIGRRCKHEPIAYITGKKEFYGAEFKVNKQVLIPRPDTEILVELAVKCISPGTSKISILDLGTGSGCLLLTLLNLFSKSSGVGIDIQAGALAVARKNASHFGLSGRACFSKQNWNNLRLKSSFDLIVSNPPYIKTRDISELETDVKKYEPSCALDGGDDGLACYRTLMPIIRKLLKPGGVSIFECGYGQADDIAAIANDNGFVLLKCMKDYSGIARAIALTIV